MPQEPVWRPLFDPPMSKASYDALNYDKPLFGPARGSLRSKETREQHKQRRNNRAKNKAARAARKKNR